MQNLQNKTRGGESPRKGDKMKKITVRTNKEFEAKVKEIRAKGFNIITFAKNFAELEKDNEIIVIEK